MNRQAMLDRIDRMRDTIDDGSPFSAKPDDFDEAEFVLRTIGDAPAEEMDVLIDLLMIPPTKDEARAVRSTTGLLESGMLWYLSGCLAFRPERLVGVVTGLVCDERRKGVVLEALALLPAFLDGTPDVLLPALNRAWRCAASEDEVRAVISSLSGSKSPDAQAILEWMLADERMRSLGLATSIENTLEYVSWPDEA